VKVENTRASTLFVSLERSRKSCRKSNKFEATNHSSSVIKGEQKSGREEKPIHQNQWELLGFRQKIEKTTG